MACSTAPRKRNWRKLQPVRVVQKEAAVRSEPPTSPLIA
jgi:hypothetical protein